MFRTRLWPLPTIALVSAPAAAQPFDATERAGLDAIGRRIEHNLQGSGATVSAS